MLKAIRSPLLPPDEKAVVELIFGYAPHKLSCLSDTRNGHLFMMGDYAYANMQNAQSYRMAEAAVQKNASVQALWLPAGTPCSLPAKERIAFSFARYLPGAPPFVPDVQELLPSQVDALVTARQYIPEFTMHIDRLDLEMMLALGIWRVFCVMEGDTILASATCAKIDTGIYKVQSVLTLPAYRRKGLARLVLRGVFCALAHQELLLMYFEEGPGRLYKSMGFEVFAGIDMVKLLR